MPPTSDPPEADYGKLDASLASAMHDAPHARSPYLSVFVHLDHAPDPAEREVLSNLGLPDASSRRRIITANLSPEQVAQLSQQSLVRQLRLSQRLDLQPGPPDQGPEGSPG